MMFKRDPRKNWRIVKNVYADGGVFFAVQFRLYSVFFWEDQQFFDTLEEAREYISHELGSTIIKRKVIK